MGYFFFTQPQREGGGQYAHQIPSIEGKWSSETHLIDLPTNAYGTITFINETTGILWISEQ